MMELPSHSNIQEMFIKCLHRAPFVTPSHADTHAHVHTHTHAQSSFVLFEGSDWENDDLGWKHSTV